MIYEVGDYRWLDVVKGFRNQAFRLETQPIYMEDVKSGLLDLWLASDGNLPNPKPNAWSEMIQRKVSSGAEVRRIRIDHNSMYQEWLRWYSDKNINAGEVHDYICVSDYQRFEHDLPEADRDFWIIDGAQLVVFFFDNGEQTVEVTKDLARVAAAMALWDNLNAAIQIRDTTVA